MTTTDKRSLISESVAVIQIDIHLVGKEPDWHIVRVAPGVSRTTTVGEVYTKSKSGLCSRDEVLAPSDARLGHHLELPHSPSNKPPQSREGQFDKVVPGLLGLSCPIKPDMRPVQIKACHRDQNDTVLNRHRRGLPPWNLGIVMTLSLSIPSEWIPFPSLPRLVTFSIHEHEHKPLLNIYS
jgi:hypothetical protein